MTVLQSQFLCSLTGKFCHRFLQHRQLQHSMAKAARTGNLLLRRWLVLPTYAVGALQFTHSALQYHRPATFDHDWVKSRQIENGMDASFFELDE